MTAIQSLAMLLRRAYAGEDLTLDRQLYTLHDITQLAIALRPSANLAIQHADLMTPLERASVSSVGTGRILFVEGRSTVSAW